MRKILLLALVVCVLGAGLAPGAMKGSADVVKVSATPTTLNAAPGDEVAFAVKVNIQNTWHLYAHGDTTFIGLDLVPDEDFVLTDFAAVYPEGHEGEFFGEKVTMIDGKEKISVTAKVPADLTPGEHALALKVTAQACDDKTCLAPAYIPVQIKLVVE
jgi:hypothetical protein